MPYEVTIRTADGELELPLPDDLADRLRLRNGDRVHLIETSQGLMIVPHDDEFAAALNVYEEGVSTYETALRALADPSDA